MVEQGQPAPGLTLESDTGDQVTLSQFRGTPVVLYFYPPRPTRPVCSTGRAASATTGRSTSGAAPPSLWALSPDDATAPRFRQKYDLAFLSTLLADPDHRVAELYGARSRAEPLRQDVHRASLRRRS